MQDFLAVVLAGLLIATMSVLGLALILITRVWFWVAVITITLISHLT